MSYKNLVFLLDQRNFRGFCLLSPLQDALFMYFTALAFINVALQLSFKYYVDFFFPGGLSY